MKLHRPAILVLLACLLAPAVAMADRGRPKIVGNTLVADNGWPIRGEHIYLGYDRFGQMSDVSRFRHIRDDWNMNTVRILIYRDLRNNEGWWFPVDAAFLSALDNAVNSAAAAGMYAIIDYHPWPHDDDGPPTAYYWELYPNHYGDWIDFWQAVAPRYKDRTHVIYEWTNEPTRTWDDKSLDYQVEGYQMLRGFAPDTPLLLWTTLGCNMDMKSMAESRPAIDYSNALFAYHYYTHWDKNNVLVSKAAFPMFMSEYTYAPGYGYAEETRNECVDWHEQNGISWVLMGSEETETGGVNVTWDKDPGALDDAGNQSPPGTGGAEASDSGGTASAGTPGAGPGAGGASAVGQPTEGAAGVASAQQSQTTPGTSATGGDRTLEGSIVGCGCRSVASSQTSAWPCLLPFLVAFWRRRSTMVVASLDDR